MSSPLAALGNRTPEQLRVPELREELRKRGIQFKGLKKDLVDRLEEVLRQEEAEQIALAKKTETAGDDASPPSETAGDGAPDPVTPSADKGTDDEERETDAGPKENVAPEPENVVMAEDTSKETSGGVEDLPAQGQEKEVIIADIASTVANVESEAEVTNLNIEVATTVTVVEETMVAAPAAVVNHSEAPLEEKVAVQSAPINEEEPKTEVSTTVEEVSVSESVVVVQSTVDNEDIVKPVVMPEGGLGDLNVVQEEVIEEKPVEAEVVTAVEVGGGEVDEPAVSMNVEEQTVTTITEEETVTTTVVIEEMTTVMTATDEQTVTTNVAEQYAMTTSEEEHSTMSVDVKETVKKIEDKTDDVMEEAAEEDDRTAIDGAQEADGEAKTEAEKPMEIDANSHKDSKRKDIGWCHIPGVSPCFVFRLWKFSVYPIWQIYLGLFSKDIVSTGETYTDFMFALNTLKGHEETVSKLAS
jgi:apoptotic chromatin condensation inducer in the nucleus